MACVSVKGDSCVNARFAQHPYSDGLLWLCRGYGLVRAVMLPDIEHSPFWGHFLSPASFSSSPSPSLSLFPGSAGRHCYLPNIVWQRRGIFYWLKIKVAKSPPRSPPLLLAALKNRGKHQFLSHQWRLHNQLKKTLVWGCKSYLCLISAFRRCMSGFNVTK